VNYFLLLICLTVRRHVQKYFLTNFVLLMTIEEFQGTIE